MVMPESTDPFYLQFRPGIREIRFHQDCLDELYDQKERELHVAAVWKPRFPYRPRRKLTLSGSVVMTGPKEVRRRRTFLRKQSKECRPKRLDADIARRRRTAVRRLKRKSEEAAEFRRIDEAVRDY